MAKTRQGGQGDGFRADPPKHCPPNFDMCASDVAGRGGTG